jgi:hypothetical protein
MCVCVYVCACLRYREFRRVVHLNINKALSDLQEPLIQQQNMTTQKAGIVKHVWAETWSAQQLVTGWTIREIESRSGQYFSHPSQRYDAHPISSGVSTGSFPRVKRQRPYFNPLAPEFSFKF